MPDVFQQAGNNVLPVFSGREPRSGQWCKFLPSAADPATAERWKAAGAWQTADGHFVGIFAAAHVSSIVTITHADGTKDVSGGEPVPALVYLVDERGHNVPEIVHTDGGGHELHNLRFEPHTLESLHPMTDRADYPPLYVGNTAEHPRA